MYLGISPNRGELWVGDRKNSRLVILQLRRSNILLDTFIPTPAGLFHSMNTQDSSVPFPLLWTTCDKDDVTVVHDLTTRRKLAEIPLPETVRRLGGFPHDVSSNKDYGFVTYIGNSDGAGYVASYDSTTFQLIKLIRTAEDPHIAIRDTTQLAIAAQGGEVILVSIPDLKELNRDDRQPSPHGTIITNDTSYLYVTNIAEEGKNAVVSYNAMTLDRLRCPTVDTSRAVPHNPKTNFRGTKLFITHSEASSDVVSVFDIEKNGCPDPRSERLVKTGFNPFGICLLPPSPEVSRCQIEQAQNAGFGGLIGFLP